MTRCFAFLLLLFGGFHQAGNCIAAQEPGVVVGSKNFTEGVIIRAVAASTGMRTEHRQALGGTRLVFNALVSGEIDIYAECPLRRGCD